MRKTFLLFLLIGFAATASFGADVHLTPFGPFHSPIGIDYKETSNKLIVSTNYPSGLPNNLELVNTTTGAFEQFSTLSGREDEIKVATVRTTPGCQQFPVGDVFVSGGSNHPGEVVRISSGGTIYPPAAINGFAGAWVKLPGETGLIRGSLYVDRSCVWGGDLIVGTGDGFGFGTGNIWRVKSTGAAILVAHLPSLALPATPGALIEGLITLPRDSQKYGPWAGTILAGDENLEENLLLNGTIWAIAASGPCPAPGIAQASGACATPYNLSYNDPLQNNRHHPMKPEDLDIIEAGSSFYGLDWGENQMLKAPASDFVPFIGDILLTQEKPLESPNSSGLYVIHWNPTLNNGAGAFVVTELKFAAGPVQHIHEWEHVTLAPDVTFPPNLITVTQGGWGATPHGNNPASFLRDNFALIGPVVIGCTFKLTFTSQGAIETFLPAGGTPDVLTGNATDPSTSAAGVFAGQVLALQLNVGFSNLGKLGSGLASYVMPSGPAAGQSVGQILIDANKALGGCGLPSYVTSISQLNDVVTSINEKFDK